MTLAKALKVFEITWVSLVVLLVGLAYVGLWWHGGWTRVMEYGSPGNLTNVLVTLVLLSPAYGAYCWRMHLLAKNGTKI